MLRLARYSVLAGALCLLSISLICGGIGLLASGLASRANSVLLATASASLLVLGAGLGLGLAAQAWASLRGRPSAPFFPARVWPLSLLFVFAVVMGHSILTLHVASPFAFPPFHLLATGLPPLILLAAVGRGLRGSARWREIVLQVSSGALVSTTLAFLLELVLLLILLVGGLILLALLPVGSELLRTVVDLARDPRTIQGPDGLVTLARSPIVVAAILAIVAGLIPIIEESIKTVGVGLLAYRRPDRAQTFLWGVAGGAGFALVEGMINTATALELWLPVVLLRVGGTVLQCTTGGLMGLAWHAVLSNRQRKRGLRLFGASLAVHGLWNALTVAMVIVPLEIANGKPAASAQMGAGLATIGIVALLILLSLVMGLGLVRLTRSIQSSIAPPQAGAPLTEDSAVGGAGGLSREGGSSGTPVSSESAAVQGTTIDDSSI